MTYFVTNFYGVGDEGEVFLRQNGGQSPFCCQAGKSTAGKKAKVTLSEKETERIISLWSEKKVQIFGHCQRFRSVRDLWYCTQFCRRK